jgi:heme exporter protein C
MMFKVLSPWISPKLFSEKAGRLLPWVTSACLLCFVCGLVGGLYLSPADYQQGDAFRIIYIHVPAAFASMFVYAVMTSFALMTLVWRIKIADIFLAVSARLGAIFTLIALITGALWGKPMWGTYWIWDARLTSELILLFIYLGVIALRQALATKPQQASACALWVLVGAVDLPIIHYSVVWWNTLHQGATLSKLAIPSISTSMLWPLLVMIGAFLLYYFCLLLQGTRVEMAKLHKHSSQTNQGGNYETIL